MYKIRRPRPDERQRIIEIWSAAVDATHDFLSSDNRAAIDVEARAYLTSTPLWVATDSQDRPIGFMALAEERLDALFIDPQRRGLGIGRALVDFARTLHRLLDTEVNAQNLQAVGFYRTLGFVEIGRSATDDQGRPYPLIRMRFDPEGLS